MVQNDEPQISLIARMYWGTSPEFDILIKRGFHPFHICGIGVICGFFLLVAATPHGEGTRSSAGGFAYGEKRGPYRPSEGTREHDILYFNGHPQGA